MELKTVKMELRNDFHNTRVILRVRRDNGGRLSWSQVQKAQRTLCGIDGCMCSGLAGERPAATEAHGPRDIRIYRHQPARS